MWWRLSFCTGVYGASEQHGIFQIMEDLPLYHRCVVYSLIVATQCVFIYITHTIRELGVNDHLMPFRPSSDSLTPNAPEPTLEAISPTDQPSPPTPAITSLPTSLTIT